MSKSYLLTKRERRFFDVAKAVSKTSDYDRYHIGCVVVYNKNILSVASNSEKTHSLQKIYNKFRNFDTSIYDNKVHAEIHALSWLIGKNIDWSKISIYIYRSYKNGMPAISKPCKSCYNLIKDLGIKEIFYIDSSNRFCKSKTLDLINDY